MCELGNKFFIGINMVYLLLFFVDVFFILLLFLLVFDLVVLDSIGLLFGRWIFMLLYGFGMVFFIIRFLCLILEWINIFLVVVCVILIGFILILWLLLIVSMVLFKCKMLWGNIINFLFWWDVIFVFINWLKWRGVLCEDFRL